MFAKCLQLFWLLKYDSKKHIKNRRLVTKWVFSFKDSMTLNWKLELTTV